MVSPSYRISAVYSTIFWELMTHSKYVPGDLAALGLDGSYARYIGTHDFSPAAPMGDPAFESAFRQRTSYARLGWFYVTRPARAYALLRAALGDGGRQLPTGGNFDASSGMPNTEAGSFVLWSRLKRRAFHGRGPVFVWTFLAVSAAFVYLARRAGATALACALVAAAALDLGVSALADVVDRIRHLMVQLHVRRAGGGRCRACLVPWV